MDDTTWITETKESLEEILKIADNFYNLNNIKVNKEKLELLVNIPDDPYIYDYPITLKFGQKRIRITPKKHKESARILGIWVNLDSDHKFDIQQCKNEVIRVANILKRKLLTNK